jgi:hypothetical protein
MAVPRPRRRRPAAAAAPVTRTPARLARLAAIAAAHDQMEAAYLPAAAFHPAGRPAKTDYNLHYLDVNPPAGAEDMFQMLAAAPGEA